MSNPHVRLILEVLPVLRNLNDFVGGYYEGDSRGLQIEARLLLIKVEERVRETMRNDILTAQERVDYDSAMDTLVAMRKGTVPFDPAVEKDLRDYMSGSLRRHIRRRAAAEVVEAETKIRRTSKH